MKNKIIIYGFITLFFYYSWYYTGSYIINSTPVMNEYWLKEITGGAQGYSSLRNYKFIYVIIFLLFAPFLLNKQIETAPFISRYASKNKIYCKRIKNLIIYAFLFSFIHIAVNFFSILSYFDIASQLRNDLLKISTIQGVYVFFYFLIIALIYSVLVDVMKKMFTAQLLTLVVVFVLARLQQLNIWTPVIELDKYERFFFNDLTLNNLLWGLGLYVIVCSILLIVLHETLKKRDFIND